MQHFCFYSLIIFFFRFTSYLNDDDDDDDDGLLCYQSINQSNYFIVRLKVDQRAGQLSLPHLGITKTEKNRTKT